MSKEEQLVELFEQLDDSQFDMVLNFTKTLVASQGGSTQSSEQEYIAPVTQEQPKRKRRSKQAGAGRRKRERFS